MFPFSSSGAHVQCVTSILALLISQLACTYPAVLHIALSRRGPWSLRSGILLPLAVARLALTSEAQRKGTDWPGAPKFGYGKPLHLRDMLTALH